MFDSAPELYKIVLSVFIFLICATLAGLKVTEKFDLINFFCQVAGWPGGQVAGESGIKANLSLSLS